MKHAIGGAAVGFLVALMIVTKPDPKGGWYDLGVWALAVLLVVVPFALAAWGLLP